MKQNTYVLAQYENDIKRIVANLFHADNTQKIIAATRALGKDLNARQRKQISQIDVLKYILIAEHPEMFDAFLTISMPNRFTHQTIHQKNYFNLTVWFSNNIRASKTREKFIRLKAKALKNLDNPVLVNTNHADFFADIMQQLSLATVPMLYQHLKSNNLIETFKDTLIHEQTDVNTLSEDSLHALLVLVETIYENNCMTTTEWHACLDVMVPSQSQLTSAAAHLQIWSREPELKAPDLEILARVALL